MTFVFPVLLGGLVLAGIPILLHLIMRQKPKTLAFPAFRFLVQRQRTNLRKLQLRHLLLLALRILLIVLLCLALGRPRLFNQALNLNSERPIAVVLVFDTSLSMEYQTSDKLSRLDEARRRGLEFVNELPSGSRVVVLDSGAASAASQRGDWLVSMSQVRDRIKALKARPDSVPVLQTVGHAYRILGALARNKEDETRRYLPRFVCVFSDRTRACWDLSKLAAAQSAADQVPPSLEGLQLARDKIAPLIDLLRELRSKLPPPPGRDYPEQALIDSLEQLGQRSGGLTKADFPLEDNLSAQAENIQRRGRDLLELVQPADDKKADDKKDADEFRPKLIKNLQGVLRDLSGAHGLFVDVGIEQPVDLAITHIELPALPNGQPRQVFAADDKIVLRAIVKATGKVLNATLTCKLDKKTYQQPAEIKAGQALAVPFELDALDLKLGPGQHQVEVRIDPTDLLPFNNRRFATFAIEAPRKVLVLTEDAAKPDGKAADFVRGLQSVRCVVDVEAPQNLNKIDALPYQAIFLFEVPAPDDRLWGSLLGFVQQGISLGIVPGGKETVVTAYNQEAAQKIMPAQLDKIVAYAKDDGKSSGAIWDLDNSNIFQHPFMRPFADWKENDVVKYPSGAFNFWAVKDLAQDVLSVVFYKDKDPKQQRPALLERRLNLEKSKPGKVLLFTTLLDARLPRWNNYLETTRNAMYVTLIGQSMSFLAGETEAPKLNFITGQEDPVVALPPVARFPSYMLMGPELEPIAAPDRQGDLKLRQAETPGNYVLTGVASDAGGNKRVAAFSVNVPSEESDLSRVPMREIESLLGAGAVVPVDRKANIREVLEGHWNEPVELFPLLMVILLVILAMENLLANKFYRRDNDNDALQRGSANRGQEAV